MECHSQREYAAKCSPRHVSRLLPSHTSAITVLTSASSRQAAFAPSGNGVYPDFEQFRVTDSGQTIQLGPYEATTESFLYEFDPDYRRRIGKERRASEQSFEAALRPLRKQRGLCREDFAPLSAKTIARIEQGEVLPDDLRERTWRILSQKQGRIASKLTTPATLHL